VNLKEELSPVALTMQGNISLWLSGILIRNGSVKISIQGKSNCHWFDGFAMLHAFTFGQDEQSF